MLSTSSMWPKGTWACVPWLNGSKPALCWPLNCDWVDACDSSTCCRKDPRKPARLTVTCAWPESLTLELDVRKYCKHALSNVRYALEKQFFLIFPAAVRQLNHQHFGPFLFKQSRFVDKQINKKDGRQGDNSSVCTVCHNFYSFQGINSKTNYLAHRKIPLHRNGVDGEYFNHLWELSNFNLQNVVQH